MTKYISYTIITFLFVHCLTFGQNQYTIKKDTVHKTRNPKAASLMSTFIPGLGQIYNQQYWKVPIIYGGFGTMAYFVKFNNTEYIRWRDAYVARTDEDSLTIDKYPMASDEQLRRLKEEWRRYRDLNYIGIAVLYFMQIIDASVDANLFDYDIGDDLSLHIEPAYFDPKSLLTRTNQFSSPVGIKCTIRF